MIASLLHLFFIFFKIGLFTIGGGLATLPLLQAQLVYTGLLAQQEFINMIAISQSTPGPIGINMATYAGFKISGLPGAVTASAGIVAPSLIIILLIAAFMHHYNQHPRVKSIMSALRPAATGLIASAVLFVFGKSLFISDNFKNADLKAVCLFAALAVFYKLVKPHPAVLVAVSGIAGITLF